MPQEHIHHPTGPLALAAALASVAGFIDAHVYLHVTPVFVANMSGNMVHLGMFAGLEQWQEAAGSAAALAAFLAGVVCATVHHDRELRLGRTVRPDALLVVEALLVLMLPVMLIAFDIRFTADTRLVDYPVIALGAFAMGIQTAALRRVGQIAVATTYGTGTIVRIGEKVVLAARGANRVSDHRRRATVWILVAVLVSYVAGAAVAAAAGSSPWLLLIPTGVLVIAAMLARRESARPPSENDAAVSSTREHVGRSTRGDRHTRAAQRYIHRRTPSS